MLKEEWLHWIWQHGRFAMHALHGTEGETLRLLKRGTPNTDAGPDFSEALIEINGTCWAGQVEMHVKASEWYHHNHHHDPAYDNVILHVVWESDTMCKRNDGSIIPCLELKHYVEPELPERIELLCNRLDWLPCQGSIRSIPSIFVRQMIDRALIGRLQQRAERILQLAARYKYHWEHVLFIWLARNFGFKTNAEPFEQLAGSIDPLVLMRHRHHAFQSEALLFGQSGLLKGHKDAYALKLADEYAFLSHKYALIPMKASSWKFMRMRPLNFPTLRIAQFSVLLNRQPRLFEELINTEYAGSLLEILDVAATGYWNNHYRFGLIAPEGPKHLGRQAAENIVVNTLAPVMFAYGLYTGRRELNEKAVYLLSGMPAENNAVIRKWTEAGIRAGNAAESQALISQRHDMCEARRCHACPVGSTIICKPELHAEIR
jgi:hypothetical protein